MLENSSINIVDSKRLNNIKHDLNKVYVIRDKDDDITKGIICFDFGLREWLFSGESGFYFSVDDLRLIMDFINTLGGIL